MRTAFRTARTWNSGPRWNPETGDTGETSETGDTERLKA
jgi:hypothetical protein